MERTQLSPPPVQHGRARGTHETRAGLHDPHFAQPRPLDDDNGRGHSEEDWGPVRKASKGWMIAVGIVVVLLLAGLFATGFIPRVHSNSELKSDAEAARNGAVLVTVIQPKPAAQTLDVNLPGTLRPWQEVSIFARSTGYLKKWYADISNHVTKGELMAEIDSPEIDQQLLQARASVLQNKAAQVKSQSDLQLTQLTYNRFLALKGTSGITQQDLDQKAADLSAAQANLEAAKANVTAAEANVQRLVELQSYEKVTAPFDGVVTGRAYDTGALINADPTSADIKPMYKIAENDVLRVFVNVPQSSALAVQKGMQVKVLARERPGRVFTGVVMGTTNYLDPANRSLLTEIKVLNGDGALLPGMYVEANFEIHRDKPPLVIPAPALIVNADGTQVAVVKDDVIHFQKVQVGEDYGNTLEITGGLEGNEQIISTPGEKIVEGAAVKVANADPIKLPGQKNEKVAEAGK